MGTGLEWEVLVVLGEEFISRHELLFGGGGVLVAVGSCGLGW